MTRVSEVPHDDVQLETYPMPANRLQLARPAWTWLVLLAVALIGAPLASAQAPAAPGNAAEGPSPEELEKIVGRIALYPDDLVAIILPASTNPLELVQADRFLVKRKQDPKLALPDSWDDSVKSLANYPDVVKMMSDDLDWTTALGEAVVADQGAVLDAVQAFRRKAQGAGNLKSDEKQVVEVEKEVIKIVPADPQVIYVPQYNPSTVVVYSSTPAWGYYPTPYPAYYYPYPPGAALATGLVWGAAIGAAWGGNHWGTNWGGGTINNNVNINRGDVNINRGSGNVNRPSQQPGGGAWKSNKQPGQVSGATGRTSANARVGDARAGGAGGGARASQQGAGGGARASQQGAGAGGNRQAGGVSVGGSATRTGGSGGGGSSAFGGYGSGRQTSMDSSRGASSRSSMQSSSRSGGGARAGGGGGGGARGGGGGGRGGGGRGR